MVTAEIENRRLKLPSASKYEIDENGFVYRCGKRLLLQNRCGRWYAQVYKDDNTRWSFDSEKLAGTLFNNGNEELTSEDILGSLGARIIPDYPHYAVTMYGAIYCIKPPKRGPNAGTMYLVRETLKQGVPHVNLTYNDGARHFLPVDRVTDMVWA